jgi:hypothetical protein
MSKRQTRKNKVVEEPVVVARPATPVVEDSDEFIPDFGDREAGEVEVVTRPVTPVVEDSDDEKEVPVEKPRFVFVPTEVPVAKPKTERDHERNEQLSELLISYIEAAIEASLALVDEEVRSDVRSAVRSAIRSKAGVKKSDDPDKKGEKMRAHWHTLIDATRKSLGAKSLADQVDQLKNAQRTPVEYTSFNKAFRAQPHLKGMKEIEIRPLLSAAWKEYKEGRPASEATPVKRGGRPATAKAVAIAKLPSSSYYVYVAEVKARGLNVVETAGEIAKWAEVSDERKKEYAAIAKANKAKNTVVVA